MSHIFPGRFELQSWKTKGYLLSTINLVLPLADLPSNKRYISCALAFKQKVSHVPASQRQPNTRERQSVLPLVLEIQHLFRKTP